MEVLTRLRKRIALRVEIDKCGISSGDIVINESRVGVGGRGAGVEVGAVGAAERGRGGGVGRA